MTIDKLRELIPISLEFSDYMREAVKMEEIYLMDIDTLDKDRDIHLITGLCVGVSFNLYVNSQCEWLGAENPTAVFKDEEGVSCNHKWVSLFTSIVCERCGISK